MLRGNGKVQSLELVVTLPIKRAQWRIDAPENPAPAEQDAADTLDNNKNKCWILECKLLYILDTY
jgi:phage gp29-like protein